MKIGNVAKLMVLEKTVMAGIYWYLFLFKDTYRPGRFD